MVTLSYVGSEDSWDGIESFYSVGIDVTEEREEKARQRKALEEAYQAARVASSAKTNFLSSMSHDIRTPMNAIMGMSAIAQANINSPEKIKDCLDKIDTSSRHLPVSYTHLVLKYQAAGRQMPVWLIENNVYCLFYRNKPGFDKMLLQCFSPYVTAEQTACESGCHN